MLNKLKSAAKILKDSGPKTFADTTKKYLNERVFATQEYKDILFINGCGLPHPERYRVDHEIEQLESRGLTCDKVYYENLDPSVFKFYRGFIIFRCPITENVEKLIKLAKTSNKTLFYDIDDLVFDTKYTDEIEHVKNMNKSERKTYDDGVVRMGKTLNLCDYGITTTECLKSEMTKTELKDVFMNRNVASEEMVKCANEALKNQRDDKKVVLGYFSGSITHNADFKFIMPIISDLMIKHKNLYLKVAGLIDVPKELEEVRERIIAEPFVDWRKLPELIRSVDINLVPLENTIFNEAKSENKWTEASLVKVPTIASNLGALKETIKDGKTGVLCKTLSEWYDGLEKLIMDKKFRETIAENAYAEAIKHTTLNTAGVFADFVLGKLTKNTVFVVRDEKTSGGVLVIKKHAEILKASGYDAMIYSENSKEKLNCRIDNLVATHWPTLDFVMSFERVEHKKYLVQNYETDFYPLGDKTRLRANATYAKIPGVEYITISKWCEAWLKNDFKNENVKAGKNGIDPELFSYKKREFNTDEKIKILIEGDSKSGYKNVDESFRIIEKLDKKKYEIHYLSYNGTPKNWYHVDKFYHTVPHEKVSEIYQACDILLKSSLVESFSYPPLEMMATGGFVVVRPNDGNSEYLEDGKNCLLYESVDDAVQKIERIASDRKLREKLGKGGMSTAKSRSWQNLEKEVLKLYN